MHCNAHTISNHIMIYRYLESTSYTDIIDSPALNIVERKLLSATQFECVSDLVLTGLVASSIPLVRE